jgi:hypothetical protein
VPAPSQMQSCTNYMAPLWSRAVPPAADSLALGNRPRVQLCWLSKLSAPKMARARATCSCSEPSRAAFAVDGGLPRVADLLHTDTAGSAARACTRAISCQALPRWPCPRVNAAPSRPVWVKNKALAEGKGAHISTPSPRGRKEMSGPSTRRRDRGGRGTVLIFAAFIPGASPGMLLQANSKVAVLSETSCTHGHTCTDHSAQSKMRLHVLRTLRFNKIRTFILMSVRVLQ